MNKSQFHITKAMVFAYFAHQATPLERQQIEAWLKTGEATDTYFAYLDEWERQFPQFQADLERGRNRFASFIHKHQDSPASVEEDMLRLNQPGEDVSQGRLKRVFGWLSVASVVLLAGLWLSKDLWYYKTRTSGNNQVVAIMLDDGSEVRLGANSSLKYPRFGFGRRNREVWLNGDAEFKVEHKPDDRRFNVYTNDGVGIEVLGTEFIVNSRPKATKVMLRTGRIMLTHPVAEQPLLMEPGELVTISPQKEIHREKLAGNVDIEEFKWKVLNFEFKDTPLKEVAEQLRNAYGIEVKILQPDISNRAVSGSFQAETPEELLDAIAEMMGLAVKETPKGYIVGNRAE